MRAYQLTGRDGGLEIVDLPDPAPGRGQVAVRVRAVSLNFRDLMIRTMGRKRIVPTSDGAGEVVAVGEGVTSVAVGDLVCGTFFTHWVAGRPFAAMHRHALGGSTDGMLAEVVVLPELGVVKAPSGYTAEQAASLPCAAVTAWNALVGGIAPLRAGQTVLLLGTGGVSVFGLQLAKMFGARVVITSSSDDKLERMRALGADVTVNYAEQPDWDKAVLEATDGGADIVLEVGGAGTLPKSLNAVRFGGQVALIGILTGTAGEVNPWPLVGKSVDLRGVYVGSREMFADMNAAIEINGLAPVIDRVFPFEQAGDAYAHLEAQRHVGKVVVAV